MVHQHATTSVVSVDVVVGSQATVVAASRSESQPTSRKLYQTNNDHEEVRIYRPIRVHPIHRNDIRQPSPGVERDVPCCASTRDDCHHWI